MLEYKILRKTLGKLGRRHPAARAWAIGLLTRGWKQKQSQRLEHFRDCHRGRRAFILGNGPSLSVSDLDLLQDEITFASNKIYLAFSKTLWRPTYYFVEDTLVAQQNWDEIDQLDGVKFFPSNFYPHIRKFKNSYYFQLKNAGVDFYPNLPGFSFDATKGFCWGSTVTYSMMQMAAFMGVDEIYLLGVDYNYQIPAKRDEENEKILINNNESNHFDPNYRKAGEKWHVPNLHCHEKAFLCAKLEVEKQGRHIINATRGGCLEIFPRVHLEDVLKRSESS